MKIRSTCCFYATCRFRVFLALISIFAANCGCSQGAGPATYFEKEETVTDADIPRRVPLNVRTFAAEGQPLTDVTAKYLARCRNLEDVTLTATKITDEGIKALAGLPRLKSLDLLYAELTDEGLKSLARCERLEYLDASGTDVSDSGLMYLSTSKSLKTLKLGGTAVTQDGIRRFKKELPRTVALSWGTVKSAEVRHAAAALSRCGRLNLTPSQFDDRMPANRVSSMYLFDFDESWQDWLLPSRAHEFLKIISNQEVVSVWIKGNFGEHERLLLDGLDRVCYLKIKICNKTSPADLQAVATIGQVYSISLWGKGFNDATLEELSHVRGLKVLYIGTEGDLTAKGLDCLSRLTELKELALLFDTTSDECLDHVAKLPSLKKLVVWSSISKKALKEFRSAHPDVEIEVRNAPHKTEEPGGTIAP